MDWAILCGTRPCCTVKPRGAVTYHETLHAPALLLLLLLMLLLLLRLRYPPELSVFCFMPRADDISHSLSQSLNTTLN